MSENIKKISSVKNGEKEYQRFTLKTPLINKGDDIVKIFQTLAGEFIEDGDIVLVAESPIAISEGRAFEFSKIKYGFWAKFLSKFVKKTPAGIGLGTPETMQLAINEVGLSRILFAAFVSALTRKIKPGLFYEIAGWRARGIDGPTSGTIPPYNGFATLTPAKPENFAKDFEERIFNSLGKKIKVVVVDANDIGVNILSDRKYKDEVSLLAKNYLVADNPMGQGHESTPIVIARKK